MKSKSKIIEYMSQTKEDKLKSGKYKKGTIIYSQAKKIYCKNEMQRIADRKIFSNNLKEENKSGSSDALINIKNKYNLLQKQKNEFNLAKISKSYIKMGNVCYDRCEYKSEMIKSFKANLPYLDKNCIEDYVDLMNKLGKVSSDEESIYFYHEAILNYPKKVLSYAEIMDNLKDVCIRLVAKDFIKDSEFAIPSTEQPKDYVSDILNKIIKAEFPDKCIIEEPALLSVQLSASDKLNYPMKKLINNFVPFKYNPIELTVEVLAQGFDIDRAWRTIIMPIDKDSDKLNFFLYPKETGKQFVQIYIIINSGRVGYLNFETTVFEKKSIDI